MFSRTYDEDTKSNFLKQGNSKDPNTMETCYVCLKRTTVVKKGDSVNLYPC